MLKMLKARIELVLGTLVLVMSLCVAGGAVELPAVQPIAAYPAVVQPALLTALHEVELLLDSSTYACRRTLQEWTQEEFAVYCVGILHGEGYEAAVVYDASKIWVLAKLPVVGAEAWIPVIPYPAGNGPQWTLGRVASSGPSSFMGEYVSPDGVVDLETNQAPVARVRCPVVQLDLGEQEAFLAMASYDPDGEIVLYGWSIDGEMSGSFTEATADWLSFGSPGRHRVTLTVIDNRGAKAEATCAVSVSEEGEAGPPPSCGCGN